MVELARLMASVWKKLLMLLLNGDESAFVEPSLSATNACAGDIKQCVPHKNDENHTTKKMCNTAGLVGQIEHAGATSAAPR